MGGGTAARLRPCALTSAALPVTQRLSKSAGNLSGPSSIQSLPGPAHRSDVLFQRARGLFLQVPSPPRWWVCGHWGIRSGQRDLGGRIHGFPAPGHPRKERGRQAVNRGRGIMAN